MRVCVWALLCLAVSLVLVVLGEGPPSIPSLPPKASDVRTCVCRYEAGNFCQCGPSCTTSTTEIEGCSSGGVECELYCRNEGLDVCAPQNCRCKDCEEPLTEVTRTAQDAADCLDRCNRTKCVMDTFSEDIGFFCRDPQDTDQALGNDEAPACFPAYAEVRVSDLRGSIPISQVKVGDELMVAPGVYSQVYTLSHSQPSITAPFVQISFSGEVHPLTVSPGHYIYTAEKTMIAARAVRPGDIILHADFGTVHVTSVRRVTSRGLFNPHTLQGDVVVEGVVASCYTTAVRPYIANLLLLPLRLAYRAGLSVDLLRPALGSAWVEPVQRHIVSLLGAGR